MFLMDFHGYLLGDAEHWERCWGEEDRYWDLGAQHDLRVSRNLENGEIRKKKGFWAKGDTGFSTQGLVDGIKKK